MSNQDTIANLNSSIAASNLVKLKKQLKNTPGGKFSKNLDDALNGLSEANKEATVSALDSLQKSLDAEPSIQSSSKESIKEQTSEISQMVSTSGLIPGNPVSMVSGKINDLYNCLTDIGKGPVVDISLEDFKDCAFESAPGLIGGVAGYATSVLTCLGVEATGDESQQFINCCKNLL
jgi:hypothetical protein